MEVHVSELPDDHPERDSHILKLRAVAEGLPVEWKTAVAKVPIENCNVRWRFQCPKKWDQMDTTSREGIRFCSACRRDVYFCESVEEARQLAENKGHCVVIDLGVRRKAGDMDMLRSPAELEVEELDMIGGLIDTGYSPEPPPPEPGLLRRLWRKLTGK